MSTVIDAVFSHRIKPGMEDRFQSHLDKVLPVTEAKEPYVLGYEIFLQPGHLGTDLGESLTQPLGAIGRHHPSLHHPWPPDASAPRGA